MTRFRSAALQTRPSLQPLESRDVPGFLAPLNYAIPSTMYDMEVHDVTGDRKPDLVVALNSLDAVGVMRGDGSGRLATPVLYPAGKAPADLRVVDVNGDGRLDVVTINNVFSGTPGLSVLLGGGGGAFQLTTEIPLPSGNQFLAAGDFNRDGRLDLVTADGQHNVIDILTGDGDGTFQPPVTYPGGPGAFGVQTADLNGDDWPDVTTVNPSAKVVNVFLNRGDGTFLPPAAYAAGVYPFAHTLGDVNGDGRPDVIVSDFQGNTLNVLLANADGTLQPRLAFPTGPAPFDPRLGDFNRDGRPDVAVPQFGNSTVGVFLGNGDGTFAPHTDYSMGKTDFRALAVGDINSDRFSDVVVPTGYGSVGYMNVLRNDGMWSPPAPPFGADEVTPAAPLPFPSAADPPRPPLGAFALADVGSANAQPMSVAVTPVGAPTRRAPPSSARLVFLPEMFSDPAAELRRGIPAAIDAPEAFRVLQEPFA
jgi:hypothetical protein